MHARMEGRIHSLKANEFSLMWVSAWFSLSFSEMWVRCGPLTSVTTNTKSQEFGKLELRLRLGPLIAGSTSLRESEPLGALVPRDVQAESPTEIPRSPRLAQ